MLEILNPELNKLDNEKIGSLIKTGPEIDGPYESGCGEYITDRDWLKTDSHAGEFLNQLIVISSLSKKAEEFRIPGGDIKLLPFKDEPALRVGLLVATKVPEIAFRDELRKAENEKIIALDNQKFQGAYQIVKNDQNYQKLEEVGGRMLEEFLSLNPQCVSLFNTYTYTQKDHQKNIDLNKALGKVSETSGWRYSDQFLNGEEVPVRYFLKNIDGFQEEYLVSNQKVGQDILFLKDILEDEDSFNYLSRKYSKANIFALIEQVLPKYELDKDGFAGKFWEKYDELPIFITSKLDKYKGL